MKLKFSQITGNIRTCLNSFLLENLCIFFSERDEDFDVYAAAKDKKAEFFAAKIDDKDTRTRIQTSS
jgi:hypothetical protein